jgi:hypothetical protein
MSKAYIEVISTLKPKNNDSFPVVEDINLKGSLQSKATISERDEIPNPNRKEGMLVYVESNQTYYTLIGGIDNINWQVATFDGPTGPTGPTGPVAPRPIPLFIAAILLSTMLPTSSPLEFLYSRLSGASCGIFHVRKPNILF